MSNYSLTKDLTRSIVFTIFLLPILAIIPISFIKSQQIQLLVDIITILLGTAITIFTLLYTLENQFTDNPLFNVIQENDQYSEIQGRYFDSIKGITGSLIILITIFFIQSENHLAKYYVFKLTIATVAVIFSILRLYRGIYLFRLLEKTARELEK